MKSSRPLGVGEPVYTGPLGTWRVSQRLTRRSLEPLEYSPDTECSESGEPELRCKDTMPR